jgi:GTPase SAR1 family protein
MVFCCGGKQTEEDKKSAEINKQIATDRRKLENEVKLLLLGAGESGKSTIAKQMKIIHKSGFTTEERTNYKSIVYNNLVSAMRSLIRGAQDLGIKVSHPGVERVMANSEEYFSGPLTPEMVADIKGLWKDDGIQQAYARQNEFQLIDSANYYFENIDRLAASDYVPTEQDVLRSRAKTTGIIEIEFDVEKTHFRMVDVGGQRSERKKWMHCFQDVTAVIFCVALSEYDLKLQEDDQTNRMHESLKLFKEICNSKWFTQTSMILFLNKQDIFQEKIKRIDLNVCFPEYTGGKDYAKAVKFITDKFLAQNENPAKIIYPHVTTATDTNNITVVFNASKDIILRKALDSAGII